MRPRTPGRILLDQATREEDFLQQVRAYARLMGFWTYHTRMSRRSDPGWPDLVLCRPPRLLFVELKREGKGATPQQAAWLERLGAVPCVETALWTPADWPEIEDVLRQEVRDGFCEETW